MSSFPNGLQFVINLILWLNIPWQATWNLCTNSPLEMWIDLSQLWWVVWIFCWSMKCKSYYICNIFAPLTWNLKPLHSSLLMMSMKLFLSVSNCTWWGEWVELSSESHKIIHTQLSTRFDPSGLINIGICFGSIVYQTKNWKYYLASVVFLPPKGD